MSLAGKALDSLLSSIKVHLLLIGHLWMLPHFFCKEIPWLEPFSLFMLLINQRNHW